MRRELKRFILTVPVYVHLYLQYSGLWSLWTTSLALSSTGFNYTQFLLPGIIAQTLLFTSIFLGISVIWDRQFGFMKEILVAPIGRISIFAGKMFGVGTAAMFQELS